MSLDVSLRAMRSTEVFTRNITHNLGAMAKEAGLYEYLWHPEEKGVVKAVDLIIPLSAGLGLLEGNPDYFKQFNPENGWGDYEGLVAFVENYLQACRENPDAEVSVWR